MRIPTVLCATALATVAAFPLAGVAAAQPTDLDCRDFASQAAAQTVLRSQSADPARLDADRDGWACEDHFRWTPPGPAPAGVVRAAAVQPDGEGPRERDGDGPRERDGDGPRRHDGDGPRERDGDRHEHDRPEHDRPEHDRDRDRDGDRHEHDRPEHDRPVRTVPEHQILVKPHGAADTGDGSAVTSNPAPVVLLAGGLGIVGMAAAVGTVGARRRAARR